MLSFIRKNILLFLILMSGFLFCQDQQLKEIDTLLNKAQEKAIAFKTLKQLEYAKKANALALKTGNSERIAKSYQQLSLALFMLQLPKQSLLYAQKGMEESYTKNNKLFHLQLLGLKAGNYDELNLTSQAAKERFKIINIIKDDSDDSSIISKVALFTSLGAHYTIDKKNTDSAFVYFKSANEQLKKIPEKNYFLYSDYYLYLGDTFLAAKKADSALYYFEKSYQLKQKYKIPVLYTEYTFLGNYYSEQKQYTKALDFYLKGLDNIKKYYNNLSDHADLYQKISGVYGKLGDKKQQTEYQKYYSDTQKKALELKNKNIDYALNVILKDKSDEFDQAQRKNYIYISIGILLLLIFFFFLYKLLNKDLKHKESMISEVTNSLQNRDEIITQKNHETKQLQQKVNDSYQEVIDLAKNNDPAFYFRFQEVYPEFQKKLLEISPSLRTTELILCTYTFLGFSIKDIADYTFKSVNTVRNRKQNLRKKFDLQTEEDMGIWLRNLTGLNSQY
ncbi:hypothetical protein [Chryseobacterium sp. SIMBA_038]|uniref:hypothetical protein n=1 Tax=Chryseobacterium sp. SIMBA_038 TaxID=3085780 RepID=UPI00397D0C41